MTRCCALLCENTGIRKFPQDKKRRQQWESAVRINGFKAKDSDRLCGIHYAYLSINLEQAEKPSGNDATSEVAQSRKAIPAVKAGAKQTKPVFKTKRPLEKAATSSKLVHPEPKRLEVTKTIKATNNKGEQVPITTIYLAEHDETALQACRACLLSDCRLYSMEQLSLNDMFKQLTGLRMDEEGNLPTSLCAECAIFLRKCQRFRLKSRKAQAMMNLMAKEQCPVTLLQIQKINRESNKLSSNLSKKHIPPDHYDTCFNYAKNEEMKIEIETGQVKIEISDTEEDKKIEFKVDIDDNYDYQETPLEFESYAEQTDDNQMTKTEKKEDNDENEFKIKTKDQTDFKTIKKYATIKLKEGDDKVDEFKSEIKHEKDKKSQNNKNEQSKTNRVIKRKLRLQTKEQLATKQAEVKDDAEPRRKRPRCNLLLTNDYAIKGFEVKRLSLEEQLEAFDKRKETINYKRRAFKCDVCHKATNIKRRLEIHMLNHIEDFSHYMCDICRLRFKWRSKLEAHKRLHEYVYSCSQCSFTTSESKYANKHYEIHEGKRYPCEKCRKEFKTREGYLSHLRLRHPTFQHVCCLCGLAFVTKREMKAHHTQKHLFDSTEIPSDSPSCAECSLRFLNEDALQTHMNIYHGTDKNIDDAIPPILIYKSTKKKKISFHREGGYKKKEVVCELCGKLVKENALQLHLDEHYGHPFPCPSCDKTFKNKKRWYRHKYLVHNELEYRLDCEKCGRKLSSVGNLKRHIERIPSDGPSCAECSLRFMSEDALQTHLKQHNSDNNRDKSTTPVVFAKPKPKKKKWKDKYLVCELCGKLVRQSYMSSHIDEHAGKPYPCPFCDMKFKNKKQWHQHKYRSHNEMGYRLDCEKCGKKMSTIDNLRVHIERVHTEIPARFICEFCNKAFRIEKDMKAHINHMHLHKPWPKRGKNREQKHEPLSL